MNDIQCDRPYGNVLQLLLNLLYKTMEKFTPLSPTEQLKYQQASICRRTYLRNALVATESFALAELERKKLALLYSLPAFQAEGPNQQALYSSTLVHRQGALVDRAIANRLRSKHFEEKTEALLKELQLLQQP